jgi:hypothetical protein
MTHRIAIIGLALALALLPGRAFAVGAGETCGGLVGIPCDAGLWCEKASNACRIMDSFGTCAKIPEVCTMIHRPVCGCDGKTYGNDCQRRAARVSLAAAGPCRP